MIPYDYTKNNTDFGHYTVIKEFFSKKNHVYLISVSEEGMQKKYVLKQFNNPVSWDRETEMIRKLKACGVPVPKLYISERYYSIMEYLEDGVLLIDTVVSLEEKGETIDGVAGLLSQWLKMFYMSSGSDDTMIMDDVNFRNFILREKIYGIDFENCRRGHMEEDAGRICAYLLTYSPEFTEWKVKMASRLLNCLTENLSLNLEYSMYELCISLIDIGERRNLHIPEGILRNFQGQKQR